MAEFDWQIRQFFNKDQNENFFSVPIRYTKSLTTFVYHKIIYFIDITRNNNNNNNNNVYFKSLSYTNVLFKLEMNAQQNKIF